MNEQPPVVNESVVQPGSSRQDGIKHNRPLILAILFGVTGALGLPLLWYSPAFTRKEKIWWSVVNTAYTLGLVCIAIASLIVIRNAILELQ